MPNFKSLGLENKVKVASLVESRHDIPLTFAIPAYNRRSSVLSLIQAIQAQVREQDEVLLSDDGSTDGTFEEASKIAGIQVIHHKQNQGMVQNWNYCLENARCDWICIIHDDDTLASAGLDALRNACGFAGGPALILPTERQTECDTTVRYRFWSPGAWSVLHCPTIPSGAVIHRKIIRELGVFNPRFTYSPDLEYFPRIAAHFPVVIMESPLAIRYELHDSNHQLDTWRKADFASQLEEIQRCIVSYAGVEGPAADVLVRERLSGILGYVLQEARRRGNRTLERQYAQLLRKPTEAGDWMKFLKLLKSVKHAFREYFLKNE